MNVHEYQAKALMAEFGVPVPRSQVAFSIDEARKAMKALGGETWVVKAQVHAGGRGKAGGVKIVKNENDLTDAVKGMLGQRLITHQSGPDGQPINRVLIEEASQIEKELYLACLVDRDTRRIAFIASADGGMDIEEVAAKTPERIHSVTVDPAAGLQPYQCRKLGFAIGLEAAQVGQLTKIMLSLYRLFTERDLSLLEINPLIVNGDGNLVALDGKINIEDNAMFRQKALAELYDPEQEEPKERRAREVDLNYVALEGNIGCMVNGAGLAMATMDVIKLHGGQPANFLDVGGTATAERVAEALRIILSDQAVKAVLINIFGGIVRCDMIAEGIITAVKEVRIEVPVVVRLEGTNAEAGRELLKESGMEIIAAENLTDAAKKAVAAVG